jgi:hypothetical protein
VPLPPHRPITNCSQPAEKQPGLEDDGQMKAIVGRSSNLR